MPDIDNERMAENLKTITKEGGIRARRIGQILRVAFSGMATELKQGYTQINPVAKELMTDVGDSLKQKSKETAEKINGVLQEQNIDSEDIFSRLRSLVQTIFHTIDEKLLPPLKEQFRKLDLTLSERYGDRYHAAKQFLEDLKTPYEPEEGPTKDASTWRQSSRMRAKEKDGVTWYEPVEAQVEARESSPFGQPPKEANGKVFTVETSASQSDVS